jgi:poly(glycerol-phosphate) alpha-glucosyltransferase
MRILHVIRGMANSSGPTHSVITLSEGQAREGHQVTLFYVAIDNEPAMEPDRALVESKCFPITGPFRRFGYSKPFRNAIRGSLGNFNIIHIHAVWNYPSYEAMRSAARAGVPFVVAPHGSLEPWALRQHRLRKWPWLHLMEKPLFHRATAMHALTGAEARQVRDFGIRAPVFICPNGVGARREPYGAERDRSGNAPKNDRFTFLFLSRVHPKKGLDILAAALGRLRGHSRNWRALIAGDDAGSGYLAEVKALFAREGIADRCEFLGDVRGPRKEEALAAADVFVLPSYSEGLPVAVLEAMAAGLPVVITPGCNLPEVAEAGAGLIAQAEPSAMAEAMGVLLEKEELRKKMGNCARLLVEQKYTDRQIACRTLAVYENILTNRDPNHGLAEY